jgi:hypothetical protein
MRVGQLGENYELTRGQVAALRVEVEISAVSFLLH